MWKFTGTAILSATCALFSTGVAAQDSVRWGGGYLGAQVGYLDSNIGIDYEEDVGGFKSKSSPDANGTVGGVYGGYNWSSIGPWVYGVEGEYNWSSADGSGPEVEVFSLVPGANLGSYTTSLDATAALRAKIGYASGANLFYGTLGVAYVDYSVNYDNPAPVVPARRLSSNKIGWTVGLGYERDLGNQWAGRIDYRYSDFGSATIGSGTVGTGTSYKFESDIEIHEIRIGLARRF